MRGLFLSLIITLMLFRCFGSFFPFPDMPAEPPGTQQGESAATEGEYYSVTPSFTTGAGTVEEHFTVNLPESWREDCIVTHYEMDFTYSATFCEKNSYNDGYGGTLFSIYADSVGEDYSYFPNYEVLGALVKDGYVHWTLVVLYPTDVQFSPENYEKSGI